MRLGDLDRVAGQHLLAQVVLVLADGALPLSGGLVLADHNVLGNLVEKSVMKMLVMYVQL
jgi:hypothetical protein